MIVRFIGTTTGSDAFSVSQGQLALVIMTERAYNAGGNPVMNYVSKIKFTDN